MKNSISSSSNKKIYLTEISYLDTISSSGHTFPTQRKNKRDQGLQLRQLFHFCFYSESGFEHSRKKFFYLKFLYEIYLINCVSFCFNISAPLQTKPDRSKYRTHSSAFTLSGENDGLSSVILHTWIVRH